MNQPETRLNEYTQDEWWDVCHQAKPELTREEFDRLWDEFQVAKAKRRLQ